MKNYNKFRSIIIISLWISISSIGFIAIAADEGGDGDPSYNCKWLEQYQDCDNGFMAGCRCVDVPSEDD